MLRFQYIEMKNFMSTSNELLKFDYQTGLTYVYGENHDVAEEDQLSTISNGSGKTVVLVDAPLFALYGRTQRKIKRSEIVNNQNKSNCEVRLCFEKDDDEYIIERGLKPDKVVIIKNGVPESEESKKRQANKIIEEEILDGISFEVFKNLIVLNGTSTKHFFEYGKHEKRNFINEVFRLGFLDFLQIQLTDQIKQKKNELEKYDIQKVAKEEEIQRLKTMFTAAESGEVVDLSQDLQTKILEESTKIDEAKLQIQKIEREFFGGDLQNYNVKYEFAKQKINSTNEEIIRLDASIQNLKNRYENLKTQYNYISSQNECPQCTQRISPELRGRLYKNLVEKGEETKKEALEIKQEKKGLEDKIQKMRDWITRANGALETHRNNTSILSQATLLLQEYQKQLNNKPEGGINIEKINEEIQTLENNFQDFLNEMNLAVRDYQIHKVCRDLVGGKNFYGFYISVFRKYLNNAINEYLEKMVSPHRIKFNNDLEADVFDGNLAVHSYENLSTGEKAKINIALLLSFFDVLHSFHRMETSLLILDEVLDSGVDTQGIYALHKILKEKAKESPHLGIYVVSHKNSDSAFTNREEVKKVAFVRRQGFTTIKDL